MGLDAFHYFFMFLNLLSLLKNHNLFAEFEPRHLQFINSIRCKYWFPFTCSGHNETPMSDECGSFHMKRLLALIGRKWKLQFWWQTDDDCDEITTRKCPQWFNRSGWFSKINDFTDFFLFLVYNVSCLDWVWTGRHSFASLW